MTTGVATAPTFPKALTVLVFDPDESPEEHESHAFAGRS